MRVILTDGNDDVDDDCSNDNDDVDSMVTANG